MYLWNSGGRGRGWWDPDFPSDVPADFIIFPLDQICRSLLFFISPHFEPCQQPEVHWVDPCSFNNLYKPVLIMCPVIRIIATSVAGGTCIHSLNTVRKQMSSIIRYYTKLEIVPRRSYMAAVFVPVCIYVHWSSYCMEATAWKHVNYYEYSSAATQFSMWNGQRNNEQSTGVFLKTFWTLILLLTPRR